MSVVGHPMDPRETTVIEYPTEKIYRPPVSARTYCMDPYGKVVRAKPQKFTIRHASIRGVLDAAVSYTDLRAVSS